MHPDKVPCVIALLGDFFPPVFSLLFFYFLESTLDTPIQQYCLIATLTKRAGTIRRASKRGNSWKRTKGARVSRRVHLRLSRYSRTWGNWLLIAAINMWWLSASNSCSISTVQFNVTTHSFPSEVISRYCENCPFCNDISKIREKERQ